MEVGRGRGDVVTACHGLADKQPGDGDEMARFINAAQEKMMARAARRAHPEFFN